MQGQVAVRYSQWSTLGSLEDGELGGLSQVGLVVRH